MIKLNIDTAGFVGQMEKMAEEIVKIEARMTKGGMAGVKKVALDVYQESQNLVPVDTHNLKRTARFDNDGDGYEIIYSAEDEKTGFNYALIQHEDLTFKHEAGKQAKYLEQPFKEKIGNLEGEIAKETKL